MIICLPLLCPQAALARMTLHDHFQALVTAEDELDTISQRLLTASIKLGRAPNFCVFFDSSPRGITAAHNCTLKAVAVQVGIKSSGFGWLVHEGGGGVGGCVGCR
jgi:beta-phosphoglucomutase-like phosphatase (HAD superfamily)